MSPRRQATADRAGPGLVQAGPEAAEAAKAAEAAEAAEAADAQAVDEAPQMVAAPAGQSAATSAGQSAAARTGQSAAARTASHVAPDGGASGDGAGEAAGGPRPAWKRLPIRVPASQLRAQRGQRRGSQAGDRSGADLPIRKSEPPPQESVSGLSARLMALARMIQMGSVRTGRDGFGEMLLADAEEVLGRAGERMRLSSTHTVVVLAGGTGSGKSSLFNMIAGADFSTVGVTRPVTRDAHACVWGDGASGAILEWLAVPPRYRYSRASALDRGEDDLAGLVLVDLPDHDSVMHHTGDLVDRLVSMADVMVWVLDPQKYADAAVHQRYLVAMAGHSTVLAVVLNQSDLLDPALADECVADLRRLLDSENLHDVPILVTSAVSGAGLEDLRKLLIDGVTARRAAAARISADVDGVVSRFEPFAGDVDAPVGSVPLTSKSRLADRFGAAAGIAAVGDALRSARELRAADFIGWPVAWFARRLSGRDPIRKVRLGMLWNDLRSVTAGPAGAQQAEIDNALTDLGNELAEPLPEPWSHTVRAAVRSRADEIPAALGTAIRQVLPDEDSVVWWWRLAGVWQGLLLGAAAVAVAWVALIVAFGVFHAATDVPTLLSQTSALPWIVALAIGTLVLGAVTSSVCMRLVVSSAEREKAQVAQAMQERIVGVAAEMVIGPAEQELSELERFREETRIAARGIEPAAGEQRQEAPAG
jgi:GTP-binding protein EngB required for normal cell division